VISGFFLGKLKKIIPLTNLFNLLLSVTKFFLVFLFSLFIYWPAFAQNAPEGLWQCATKSGQLDDYTRYQLVCAGTIEFKSDRTVESSCTAAFSPTGSLWKTEADQLLLTDSEGHIIVAYTWKMTDERTLILEKKGISFTFDKIYTPTAAGN
jgi:hypothetical protein